MGDLVNVACPGRDAAFEAAWRRAARHGWKIADCQAHRYVMVLRRRGRSRFISVRMGGRVDTR